MTPNGRRGAPYRDVDQRPAMAKPLGLVLCAILIGGTAGCMASPEYPIRPGDPAGDGALHMTQRPQYPINAPAPVKPAAPVAPAPPPPAPPSDDDTPRPVPHGSVESTSLPPPSSTAPTPPTLSQTLSQADGARFERTAALDRSSLLAATLRDDVISDDGRPAFGAAPGFQTVAETVAPHHHRRGATAKDKVKTARHGKHGQTAKAPTHADRRHAHLRARLAPAEAAESAAVDIDTPYQTTVRPGERAGDVAARLHVAKQALMALNGVKPTSKLHPGQVLKVPYRLAYTVAHGDTLFAISHRFGQDMDEVAKLNGLKPAAPLHLGQTVALPLTAEDAGPRGHANGKAPLPEAAPAKLIQAELAKARAAAHRKAREDAVRLAAAAHESTPAPVATAPAAAAPAEASEIDDGVRRAAELNERELASRAAPAPAGAPAYSVAKEMATDRPSSSPWSAPSYYPPGYTAPGANAPAYNAPAYNAPALGRVRPTAPTGVGGPVSDADVSTAGRGRFVWPLRGAILTPFGDRGPGQRNDGLDISASPGESVRAAANGEVVYAGSSIPGFGNLVLVKHPGGWVTAYAHLDRIEVRMRDEVTQGEEIGQAGQTGAVDRPELHFEVRYAPDPAEKARPIDPTLVLPEAAKGDG
jgi:murein DD-endopeptidase MepM/ murein hydrolase activator NlpD